MDTELNIKRRPILSVKALKDSNVIRKIRCKKRAGATNRTISTFKEQINMCELSMMYVYLYVVFSLSAN